MALTVGTYSLSAMAGIIAPPPPPPPPEPEPEPVNQDYPDACLGEGEEFAIDPVTGELVIYDGTNSQVVTDELLASLNEDGLCSQLAAGNEVIGEEITRLLLTEYFNRFGNALQNRIIGRFFGGDNTAGRDNTSQYGRAAGDGFADWSGWSPWISYGYTSADNDLTATRYDADQDNLLFGMDYSYSDRLIFGISGAYENNDIDTTFNLGEMEVDGFSVAPYAAYLLSDSISVDASFGYSNLDIDQFRIEPGGARVSGNTDSSRWFVMSNLNAFKRYGDWFITGRAGFIYSEEEQDGFTEIGGVTAQTVADRDIEFGQLNFGGEVAYSVHEVEPFASVYYEYDFEQGDSAALNPNQARRSDDDDDIRVSAGLRYFGNNGLSATLEWSRIFMRENFDSQTINLMGRLQF